MQKQERRPRFKYHLDNPRHEHFGHIEVDGQIIHKIEHVGRFYEAFGYTQEINRAGILPEEFIWSEYIKGEVRDFSTCLQIHIIEYLDKHSEIFRQKFGEQAESWLAAHQLEKAVYTTPCAACRLKPFCGQ